LLADHISEGPDDELLDTVQVAEWLAVSTQFVEILRGRLTGPKFVRMSDKKIMYRRDAVRKWLRQREQASTAQNRKTSRGQKASAATSPAR
jgi:hypothetical protein